MPGQRLGWIGMAAVGLLMAAQPALAVGKDDPEFMHGLGQVVAGLVVELPKTVLDATLTSPPIVGTLVGVMAGTVRALQVTFGGLQEMAAGFKPFGKDARKRPRSP